MGPSTLDLAIMAEAQGFFVDYTHHLPHGIHGAWLPDLQLILLAHGLHPIRERCTLAHELGHATLGHTTCTTGHHAARQEVQADRWAAATLISVAEYELAETLVGPHPGALAAELEVTQHTTTWQQARKDTT